MTKHQGHHFITEAYQRGFADAKGHVWILTSEGKIFNANPENTFKEDHFYTIKLASGGGTLVVEKTLAQIEGGFVAAIKDKINKQELLTEEGRGYVALFVAAMLTRTKVQRNHFRNTFSEVIERMETIKKTMKSNPIKTMPIDERNGPSMTLDELKKHMDNFDSDESISTINLLQDTAPLLASMKWSILIAPLNKTFVSSDNPFCMCSPKREELYGINSMGASVGLLDEDIEITFPLTSKFALFASWEHQSPSYVKAPAEIVDQVNYRTCRTASNIIASSREQLERYKRIAKRRNEK